MKWYVLHTQYHHERAVCERLRLRGYEVYLPLAQVWRQSKQGIRQMTLPLFPGHVFVRCSSYARQVCPSRGRPISATGRGCGSSKDRCSE